VARVRQSIEEQKKKYLNTINQVNEAMNLHDEVEYAANDDQFAHLGQRPSSTIEREGLATDRRASIRRPTLFQRMETIKQQELLSSIR
jgi:hypothetical protein